MLKMACLFSMILSAQAVRFDGKAELASLSALISTLKLKNQAAGEGRIGNTTGPILSEIGESTDVLTTIREILSDIEESINAAKTEKATTHLEQCTDKVGDANTVAEEDDTVDVHLKNLVGCEPNSQCETNTNTHQQAATAARNQISQHTANLAVWNPQVGPLESNNETQHSTKAGCEHAIAVNQLPHETRLQTFVDAIAVLTKIKNSLNAETGAISTPPQLITEKEKKILGDFKVAKTMLLILNSSQSALADPDLVSTLKNLLISCISSLETSHQNEIDDHDNWVSVKNLCITTADGEITTLSQELTNLREKIANANNQINIETSNLNNAESASDTLRGACIQGNTDFLASMSTFEQELSAIGDMNVILDNSGLGDTTIAVRDETDQTKHGVHESINTAATEAPAPATTEAPPPPGEYLDLSTATASTGARYYGLIAAHLIDGNFDTSEGSCAGTYGSNTQHTQDPGWFRVTLTESVTVLGVRLKACNVDASGYGCSDSQKCQIKVGGQLCVDNIVLTENTQNFFECSSPLAGDVVELSHMAGGYALFMAEMEIEKTAGEPNYYVTGLNGICPTDDMVTTEEECVSAMLAVTNPNPTPRGKGLSYTSPTGWGGYPPNCFYHNVGNGGLHWAGNRPQDGNTPRSDVYAICSGD